MFTTSVLGRMVGSVDSCPWGAVAGRHVAAQARRRRARRRFLYTPEERQRRDATGWTMVQGVLAPVQFLIFLISLGFVLHTVLTGQGATAATASIVLKTLVLYTIMITGSVWEHKVFGRYLFAPAFFWEDAVSMLVLALHTLYLLTMLTGTLDLRGQMLLALAAYASYAVNATQFVMKLRAARKEQADWPAQPLGLAS